MKFQFIIPAAILTVILVVFGSAGISNNRTEESHYQAALRLIGHKLLLSAGDSTSRVMPVKQLSENEFQISFETSLSLEPDSIYSIISNTIETTPLPDNYTANILDCSKNEIVYGFVMSGKKENIIVPCLKRTLPKDCYYVNINFSNHQGTTSKMNLFVVGCILSIILLAYLIHYYFNRNKKSETSETEVSSSSKHSISIGAFLFYYDHRYLEINGERIPLTDKESKLLNIFASSPNEVIDRSRLQKEIWEDEGVIVTRSLDVFVSRIRKKLEKDPGLKIVNVHGKGYKLVTDGQV